MNSGWGQGEFLFVLVGCLDGRHELWEETMRAGVDIHKNDRALILHWIRVTIVSTVKQVAYELVLLVLCWNLTLPDEPSESVMNTTSWRMGVHKP